MASAKKKTRTRSSRVSPKPSLGKGRDKTQYSEAEWKVICEEFAAAGNTTARQALAARYDTSFETVRKRAVKLTLISPPPPRKRNATPKTQSTTSSASAKTRSVEEQGKNTPSNGALLPVISEAEELALYRELFAKLTQLEIIQLMRR